MNCDVARFTIQVQTYYQPDLLQDRFDVGGKTCSIAIELVLLQCCKTSCTFFVVCFSVPLVKSTTVTTTFHTSKTVNGLLDLEKFYTPSTSRRGKERTISRAASQIGTMKTELFLTRAPEFNQTCLATNQVVNKFERGW